MASHQQGAAALLGPPPGAAPAPWLHSRWSVGFASGIWNNAALRRMCGGPTHDALQRVNDEAKRSTNSSADGNLGS